MNVLGSKFKSMIGVVTHLTDEPINVSVISKESGMSISYLEQLFTYLRKAKIVEGVRGPGGGYKLVRPLKNITVAECLNGYKPETNFEKAMYDFLSGMTLDKLNK